ncbi:hypothetical protein L873DRAFT_773071 [Choiromyces venosus 120613-1]|uniref:Uncharacterized protein n=1 Tax=Choiromyces venosus 120613-1 TaxID=1336337 RepID=A0A3N4JQD1_9PEZI|nr:hypothetical protein L873DRAFT_773071 [Choiromyces venosus 120613-1]
MESLDYQLSQRYLVHNSALFLFFFFFFFLFFPFFVFSLLHLPVPLILDSKHPTNVSTRVQCCSRLATIIPHVCVVQPLNHIRTLTDLPETTTGLSSIDFFPPTRQYLSQEPHWEFYPPHPPRKNKKVMDNHCAGNLRLAHRNGRAPTQNAATTSARRSVRAYRTVAYQTVNSSQSYPTIS